MITAFQKAKILQLRGVGFTAKEIAGKLDPRIGQVRYWFSKFEKHARTQGENEVFIRVMVDGVTPEVLGFMRMAAAFKS